MEDYIQEEEDNWMTDYHKDKEGSKMAKTKFIPCKEYLKAYRIVVGAKKDERIDKRHKPYLAPNGKYYNAHCGYCAEVEYLADIYDHSIALEGGPKNVQKS